MIVVGPLLGTFTLLLNVYHDMGTTDRVNPRKKYVQVVEELIGEGLMERDTLLLAAFGFAAMGLVLAAYVSGSLVRYSPADGGGPFTSFVGTQGFLVPTILIIALSFAYSVPGIHWKGVAGMDLLTNMVGFGVLCPFLALQVLFYAVFTRRPTVGRIWALLLLLSILQALGVILMLWQFVGQHTWSP